MTNQCSDVLTVCVAREGLPAALFGLHVVQTSLSRLQYKQAVAAAAGQVAKTTLSQRARAAALSLPDGYTSAAPPSPGRLSVGISMGTPRWAAAPSNRVAWDGDANDVPLLPSSSGQSLRPSSSGTGGGSVRVSTAGGRKRREGSSGSTSDRDGGVRPTLAHGFSVSGGDGRGSGGGGRRRSPSPYDDVPPRVASPSRLVPRHQHLDKWSKPGRAVVWAAEDVSGTGMLHGLEAHRAGSALALHAASAAAAHSDTPTARAPPPSAGTTEASAGGWGTAMVTARRSVSPTGRSAAAAASGRVALSPRTAAADVAALDVAPGLSLIVELRVTVPAALATAVAAAAAAAAAQGSPGAPSPPGASAAAAAAAAAAGGEILGSLLVSCSTTTGAAERVAVPVYLRVAAPGAGWASDGGGGGSLGRRAPVADPR